MKHRLHIEKHVIIIALIAGLFFSSESHAQRALDSKLTSKVVTSLVQYIKWEKNSKDQMIICTFGDEDVGKAISALNVPNISSRITTDIDQIKSDCNIVYIGGNEVNNIDAILWKVKPLDAATISAIPGFARMGGMIEIDANSAKKLKFLINVLSAKKSNVVISSDLLSISSIVKN